MVEDSAFGSAEKLRIWSYWRWMNAAQEASLLAKSLWALMRPWQAGPVSSDSSIGSDATLRNRILSYSGTPGLLARVSLKGSTIRPDNGDNRRLYGRKIPATDMALSGAVPVPPAAGELISTLDTKTPKHRA
jgi:hypothetical protein